MKNRITSAALWLAAAALVFGWPLLLGGCLQEGIEVKVPGPRRGAELLVLPALQSPRAQAASITPITSLTASGPTQKGGSTAGAICGSVDRIDIKARTSSGTGALNLVEWVPEDSRWSLTGPEAAVTTSLTTFRYVAKRSDVCWFVYKGSGTMAGVWIEGVNAPGGAGLGSIEPASSVTALTAGTGISITGTTTPTVALSTPVSTANGGTGLSSFTANRLLYSSSTSAIGQLGCSDGQVVTWASGVPACGAAGSTYSVLGELRTTTGVVPNARRYGWQGALTTATNNASIALGRVNLAAGTYTLTAALSSTLAVGVTMEVSAYCSSTVNGTYALATGSDVTFVDSDGANAERSATFTLGAANWCLFSTLHSSGTYSGFLVAQIRAGS